MKTNDEHGKSEEINMEEYRDQLLKQFVELKLRLKIASEEAEKIVDLLEDSNTLKYETRAKITAFLDGQMTGIKEQIEWLECIKR